jgi:mono/diheme cytochrome c family protein
MVRGDATSYDRRVSRRRIRLLVVPALLFLAFAGTAFGLAKAHPAKPSAAATTGTVSTAGGDATRGAAVFASNCASCHGASGKGGSVGPRLAGSPISLAAAKAQIDNGGGIMPAGIVKGAQEDDVLAYLATILAKP